MTVLFQDPSTRARDHLLYTKFQSIASSISPLISELERRAQSQENDLNALLAECHSSYFAIRKSLLVSKVIEDIKGLNPARNELVELVRGVVSVQWPSGDTE